MIAVSREHRPPDSEDHDSRSEVHRDHLLLLPRDPGRRRGVPRRTSRPPADHRGDHHERHHRQQRRPRRHLSGGGFRARRGRRTRHGARGLQHPSGEAIRHVPCPLPDHIPARRRDRGERSPRQGALQRRPTGRIARFFYRELALSARRLADVPPSRALVHAALVDEGQLLARPAARERPPSTYRARAGRPVRTARFPCRVESILVLGCESAEPSAAIRICASPLSPGRFLA